MRALNPRYIVSLTAGEHREPPVRWRAKCGGVSEHTPRGVRTPLCKSCRLRRARLALASSYDEWNIDGE
jgi:hypothetical protein